MKKELEKNNHSVEVLSLSSLTIFGLLFVRVPSYILNKIDQGLGYYVRFPMIMFFLGLDCFFKHLLNRYYIIHCHDVIAYSSTWLCRRIFHVPVVLTLHGYLKNEALSQRETKERYVWIFNFFESLAKNAPVQLAADNRIRRYLISEINVPEQSVRSYRNFVDLDVFKTKIDKKAARNIFGLSHTKKIVLCPRRLVVKNGIINVIKAMEYLPPDFILTIAGEGPEEKILKEHAANSNRVIFLGSLPNDKINLLYRAADYTVIPSITISNVEEATSIAAVESMAADIPVIASDIGGLKELISDKKDGLLVPQANSKAIADAILWFEKNPTKKHELTQAAKKKVKNELSSEVVVREFVTVDYAKALVEAQKWKK